MADLFKQRRRNPATGRKQDYITLRWVDPITRKRRSKALGFVAQKQAEQAKELKKAQLLLLSQGVSASPGGGEGTLGAPGPSQGARPESPTLRRWFEDYYLPYFKLDHAPTTIRQEELAASWLAELLGHVPLDAITTAHVEGYKHHRRTVATEKTGEPASPRTVNIELRVLRSGLRRARALGFMATPLPEIKQLSTKAEPVRLLSGAEVEALLAAAAPGEENQDRDEGTWLAILLMANLGLRKSEALTREWTDVDLDHGVLHVTHKPSIKWFIKGGRHRKGKPRTVPMTPQVRAALRAAWEARGKPDKGWVFPAGRRGKGRGPRGECIKGIKGAARRAGIGSDVNPKMLRHAWASRLAMAGVDRKSLQDLGGWVDGRMLDEVYAHVTPQHLVDIMMAHGIGEVEDAKDGVGEE